ncbi:Uma2 family endonuclease [Kovacikia minuta CCNUW1]|uniref:Uma2 family endonuclease n=1 Tax=Kovacikia minuta TaxID=2931930 RepID=UPI001CCDE42D|nr:Uma2 family endonuclease [Kovacikia minuta]UBF25866.1 Uma2 family endonuclease [Kovacikia minuta CCNUW1]
MSLATTKRFTLDEYHRLIELGFFKPDDRIELIRGELIQMASKGTAHEVCLTRLLRELPILLGDRATLRCQSPITLLDSEPEPDFTIAQNRSDDYLSAHPSPADVLLIIEISDSSLAYDQDVKLSLYAENIISNYWIFDVINRILEVYNEPYRKPSGSFGYRVKRIVLPDEAIVLPPFPILTLNLSKVFPQR